MEDLRGNKSLFSYNNNKFKRNIKIKIKDLMEINNSLVEMDLSFNK